MAAVYRYGQVSHKTLSYSHYNRVPVSDFDQLGSFYLGRPHNLANGKNPEP